MSAATQAVGAADLSAWIGREERREDVLTADLATKFHATLGLADRLPALGDDAPDLVHFCLAQPAFPPAELGRDGHPKLGGFLPPVPLPRRMWAGGDLRFLAPLKVGDAVTRISRIADVVPKEGRTGPLCFVTVDHRIEAEGSVAVEERQTIVYRGDEAAPLAEAPPPAETGARTRHLETSPTLLFRYSALTFNGHRIHYDRRYAREVEHYGGLVVHGPLQATLLCHLARELTGRPVQRFVFRSLSPVFDDDGLVLHAAGDEADGMRLWTSRPGGPVAMTARAAFA